MHEEHINGLSSKEQLVEIHDQKISLRSSIQEIRTYKQFIYELTKVSITKSFKKSFIGLSWLFITPIISVVVWILLHGAGIVDPGTTEIPYPAYVLLSTSIWGYFSGIYNTTSGMITGNSRYMIMAKFPHEVLLIHKILVHNINFVIPFLVNLLVLLLFGVRFSWWSFLFPLTLLPLIALGGAIGLIVAIFRVVAVDIGRLSDQFMSFLMFLTPIIYSPKIKIGWLARIVEYNPLTYLIGFSRDLLTRGEFYEPGIYFLISVISIGLFCGSLLLFLKTEARLLERMINT
jgi:lipopolysaccharide transport system permease protein